MHIHAEHNGVKFNCTICFKEFKRKGSLDRHMTGVHKTESSAVFKCAVCLKEFKQKSHLKTHMKNVHHQELESQDIKQREREPSPLPTQVPQPSLTHQGLMQHHHHPHHSHFLALTH